MCEQLNYIKKERISFASTSIRSIRVTLAVISVNFKLKKACCFIYKNHVKFSQVPLKIQISLILQHILENCDWVKNLKIFEKL